MSILKTLVREQIQKLREERDNESLAWDLLDAIEGDLDDTPAIDDFFRRKGITDKATKRKILNIAAKHQSKTY